MRGDTAHATAHNVGAAVWRDTAADVASVPPGTPLANVLTGEILRCDDGRLPLARALGRCPVALLVYDAAAA